MMLEDGALPLAMEATNQTTTTAQQKQQDPDPDTKHQVQVPLFLAQPVTGLTAWDRVLLGAMRNRDAATTETTAATATRKKLQRELTKAHETRRKQREVHDEAKNAQLTRIGRAVSRAVDKCWARSKRGFEEMCGLELEIERQREAEERQAAFLKDTERLTAFLAESFRYLVADANNISSSNDGGGGDDDDDAASSKKEEKVGDKFFESRLSLLNTLNGARPLRPYQRSALTFLVNLYNNGLNAILADEMGLGKTPMTLALLAYFAEYKQDWGPHLVVVPSSIIGNWELECMRWVPGLKVIRYHGTQKERANLRKGWSAEGAFHICIASYSTVLADRNVFRRKQWGFMILDEAHQIKNWQSRAWQVLFELNAEHRLLLTGTPLQTSVMELWALLRFIVPPHVAVNAAKKHLELRKTLQKREGGGADMMMTAKNDDDGANNNNNNTNNNKEGNNNDQEEEEEDESSLAAAFENMEDFQRWFSDPLTAMVTGQSEFDSSVVTRLHTLLRPFFFRRLKCDVETQLPPKREVVVHCPLSRRQRALYEDFLALGETRNTLSTGSYIGVVRVLLSLRKVCNHPDLFAERPVAAPLVLDPQADRFVVRVPRCVLLNDLSHFADGRAAMKALWWKHGRGSNNKNSSNNNSRKDTVHLSRFSSITDRDADSAAWWVAFAPSAHHWSLAQQGAELSSSRAQFLCHVQDLSVRVTTSAAPSSGPVRADAAKTSKKSAAAASKSNKKTTTVAVSAADDADSDAALVATLKGHVTSRAAAAETEASLFFAQVGIPVISNSKRKTTTAANDDDEQSSNNADGQQQQQRVLRVVNANTQRHRAVSRASGFVVPTWACDINVQQRILGAENGFVRTHLVSTPSQKIAASRDLLAQVVVAVPRALTRLPFMSCALPLRPVAGALIHSAERGVVCDVVETSSSSSASSSRRSTPLALSDPHDAAHFFVSLLAKQQSLRESLAKMRSSDRASAAAAKTNVNKEEHFQNAGWPVLAHHFHFPERRWVLQDCGKFYVLHPLFKRLHAQGHRVLIFTQFTAMLSILERFLAFMGLAYLRLDSSLQPTERQFRVEQFNRDPRIFAMVLSTRAGGLGLNLIGADTVCFVDSDWNPAMDLQAQDRCHRIGQTRPVTIYRLVSEHTVEANIVKKARQRKLLNNVVIRSGQFHRQVGELSTGSSGGDGGGDAAADGNNNNNSAAAAAAASAIAAANKMDRNALLRFFHDKDEGDEDAAALSSLSAEERRKIEEEFDDDYVAPESNNNNNKTSAAATTEDAKDSEWLEATAAVEDAEDRAAGTAAAAEQQETARNDFLDELFFGEDSDGDDDNNNNNHNNDDDDPFSPSTFTSTTTMRCRVRRHFGTSAVNNGSWPPPLNRDPNINVRLTAAGRNATNTSVEAWAAAALPFFSRGTAAALKEKVARAGPRKKKNAGGGTEGLL